MGPVMDPMWHLLKNGPVNKSLYHLQRYSMYISKKTVMYRFQ